MCATTRGFHNTTLTLVFDSMEQLQANEMALVNEPFDQGRAASRMFFDFGMMVSCLHQSPTNNMRVLDFASGTGWMSEWLNRLGFDVWALDIERSSELAITLRSKSDRRLDNSRLNFSHGDGHRLPFTDNFFSHVCCFDSLHHMHDYPKVFSELRRVLEPGGRAIFVEPGALHSKSKETIEFLEKYKKHDPTWIERDVVLDEIHGIAMRAGFKHLAVRPCLWPQLREYDLTSWTRFRSGDRELIKDYVNLLTDFNFNSRIVFYVDR
jgi:SAM-dependent methyltransferase